MPVQDFLITFRADTAGALAQINALAQRVQQVDASLNTALAGLTRNVGAGGGPMAAIASGSGPAATGLQRVNTYLLNMGRNLVVTKEQAVVLKARLNELATSFAIQTNMGRGASINQGQVQEALRIVETLRQSQMMSAKAADKWAADLTRSYAKVSSLGPGLRNLTTAEQERVRALERQAARQLIALNQQRSPVGGQAVNYRAQESALRSYITTLRELQQYGLVGAKAMDALEQELRQVGTAAQLAAQKAQGLKEIATLQTRAGNQRGAIRQGFGGDVGKELSAYQALEKTLQSLAARGDPVQTELAQTTQKVQQLTAAASLATQRLREMNSVKSLNARATDLRASLGGGRFADAGAELRAARQLEQTLFKLQNRGQPVAAELAKVRAEVDRLAAAATRAKSLDQLLRRRASLDTKMEQRGVRTGAAGQDRDLVRAAMRNEEALARLGDPAAASRLRTFQGQFAALPPVIDRATQRMLAFNSALQQRVMMGERLNLPAQSAATLTKGLDNGIELMKRGYGEGADAVAFFQERVASLPPTLDRAAQGMLNHGRRVAEGLFIYEALGRAMQAVGAQIELVNNLAREEIRFSAVSGGLGAGGSNKLLLGLQDIAVRTNTPMDELASNIDTVGVAMLNNGDASVRMADSLQFLNDAGQFTNITQRDLASETQNLLGIFSMAEDGVEGFSDRLGRITRAGRNSSTIISGITDVLSEAGRSARATGFDFDFLASVGGQMVQDLIGTMSGSEIGGMLNTIIGRLTDPEVIQKVQELSKGMISFANADGSLRSTSSILIDIFQGIEDGLISAEAAPRILDQIVPPLNPGARAFVTALQRNIPEALADMPRIMGGTAEDAKALSDALVSGPGERFAASMKEVQGALTGIFSEEIISAGNTFADLLKNLANLLGAGEESGGIGGAIASIAVKLTLFGALMAGFSFAWRNVAAILGASRVRMEAIRAAVITATGAVGANTVAAAANSAANGAAAGQMALWGPATTAASTGIFTMSGAMAALRGTMSAVLGVAKGLLPVLLTMAAIELPGQIDASGAAGRIQSNADLLESSRIDPDDLKAALTNVNAGPVSGILEEIAKTGFGGEGKYSRNQLTNILEVAKALTILEQQGKLTAASQKAIEEQVVTATGKISEETTTANELIASMDVLVEETGKGSAAWEGYTEAGGQVPPMLDEISAAEQRAAEAAQINIGLSDERAAAMQRLTDQLRAGAITVDEWAEGQSNASQASESAANFLAHYGTQLALIPGLQERIAQTGESAGAALMGMLMDNPDTFNERLDIIDQMVAIAETNAEVAESVANNPIEMSVETEKLIMDAENTKVVFEWLTTGTYETKRVLDETKIEPQISLEKLKAQAAAALEIYKVMLQAASAYHRTTSSAMQAANPEVGQAYRARARNQSGDIAALERAIAQLEGAGAVLKDAGGELGALGSAWDTLGGIRGDDPRLDSSSARDKEPQQTSFIDIGDLPSSVISQIVALASGAQKRVVAAGGVVDTDETTAIFKDAAFQTLIRGIDQRFLQQAIEELTEVEKKRLELEQQRLQDVTRSMVTQVGPIQSIVSAPVLAAGGGILSGQGLNADPRLGNFTINVPINWSGMNLPQLQKFIYDSISKAWIDAGRGG